MEKYCMVQDGRVTLIHNMPFDSTEGLHQTRQELLATGILVEQIPEPEQREGLIAVLMYDEINGLNYEYEAAPKTPEEEATQHAIDEYTLQLIKGGVL